MDEELFKISAEWGQCTQSAFPDWFPSLHDIALLLCPEGCILVEDERPMPDLSRYQRIPSW